MSAATRDWRRIDVDSFDADKHMSAAELAPDLPATLSEAIQQASHAARTALSSGNFQHALALVLDTCPYVADEQTKTMHAETVFEVLCSIKNNHAAADLDAFIRGLSQNQHDVLIKYLYKIMALPYGAKQGGLLLAWFEKTIEIAGMGSIVRYMSDRRVV